MIIKHQIWQHLTLLKLIQFQWIFLCVGDITTPRSVHYTFGSKINRQVHSKNVYNLKNQIKFVLNFGIQSKNDTVEKYIEETFNVHNPDPEYVFILPGTTNTTLVFHRSNFTDISFPNTTSIQVMYNLLKNSKLSHERISKQFADERFFAKYKEFMSSENDLHEAESLKVIQENVRTEKNFLKFMEKINEDTDSITIEANSKPDALFKQHTTDYPTLIRNIHAKDHIGNYELSKDSKYEKLSWPPENISWDDFGLTGWIGSINKHHENPDENGSPMRIEFTNSALKQENLFPHKFLPILANYDPLALLTSSTSTTPRPYLPQKSTKWPQSIYHFTLVEHQNSNKFHSSRRPRPPSIILSSMHPTTQRPANLFVPAIKHDSHRNPFKLEHSDDAWDFKINIPDELRDLLKLERIKLENISKDIDTKSKLIVTSSWAKHRDDDIFVARANNPFGHSTKWKFKSTSSHNEVSSEDDANVDDRQKRDVIDLYSMVKCATGCDPLTYKGYGCYCGFLGSGKALDGIDRCCKMHDYCYKFSNCPKFLEYFVPYLWKCYRGRPLCAINNGEWGGPGSCSFQLCECDRALSNCLRRFYCPRKRAVCESSPLRLLQNILMDI